MSEIKDELHGEFHTAKESIEFINGNWWQMEPCNVSITITRVKRPTIICDIWKEFLNRFLENFAETRKEMAGRYYREFLETLDVILSNGYGEQVPLHCTIDDVNYIFTEHKIPFKLCMRYGNLGQVDCEGVYWVEPVSIKEK